MALNPQANHRKPLLPPEYFQTAKSLFVRVLPPVPVPIRIHKYDEACGESDGIHLYPIADSGKTGVDGHRVIGPSGKEESDATVHPLAVRHPM